MIKIIDKDFRKLNQFKEFCKLDSFGTRIYSHYLTYGIDLNFADFWVQFCDDAITCAICRLDCDFVVCACEKSDFEELSAFLNFQNFATLTFDDNFSDKVNVEYKKSSKGDILKYSGKCDKIYDYSFVTPDNKKYHDLLLSCESEDFFVPDYQSFLSDVVRRQTRGLCTVYGIDVEGVLVSCAMTVSYTDFSVILGAVATHPLHRKRGYAGFVVSTLANKFFDYGKVYIYTTIAKNTLFYKSLGFEICGSWCKLYGG